MKKNEKNLLAVEVAINSYIRQRKKQRDYWSVLRCFAKFCNNGNMFEVVRGAKEEDAIRYINFLKSEKASATAHKNVALLKGLFRALHGAGIVEKNPFALLRTPEQSTNRVRHNRQLASQEIDGLLKAVKKKGDIASVRDNGLLRVLFGHALRIDELLSTQIKNFDGESIQINNRKAGKAITCKLQPDQKKAILDWLKVRGIGEGYLFCAVRVSVVNVYAKPDCKTVNRRIKEYCDIADIPAFTSHSGRVTAVTRALEMGYSYEDVMSLTGHSSIKQVEGYDRRSRRTVNITYGEDDAKSHKRA